jgi:hypothetical protein
MSWRKYAGISLDCFLQTFLSIRHSQIFGILAHIVIQFFFICGICYQVLQFTNGRSQRRRDLRPGTAASLLLELRVRTPPGAWMSVSYDCCILSGWVPCKGPITRPGIPTECGVSECDCKASTMMRPWRVMAAGPWGKRMEGWFYIN